MKPKADAAAVVAKPEEVADGTVIEKKDAEPEKKEEGEAKEEAAEEKPAETAAAEAPAEEAAKTEEVNVEVPAAAAEEAADPVDA